MKNLRKEYQATSFANTSLIQRSNWPGHKLKILPQFKQPTQVYQLNLYTLKKEFITYVCLDDPQQQKIIAKYQKFSAQKVAEETGRLQQKMALARSFAINKLGLYNWDRLQKEKNRIRFVADFDFQQAADCNDIVVFLITDLQGASVIHFYREAWNHFSIDPTVNNRRVAVLPKNKTAIVSQEQMAKIDWQKVKKEKKYTKSSRLLRLK